MPRSYLAAPDLTVGAVDDQGHRRYPQKRATVPGTAVIDLQQDLFTLGFLLEHADGLFGPHTANAVKGAQKAAGQAVTGSADADLKRWLSARVEAGSRIDPIAQYDYLLKVVTGLGFTFEHDARRLNLLGVRGYWNGEKVDDAFNAYNDTLYAAWVDAKGNKCVERFEASCDPGRLSAEYKNPAGVAHLVEGQWHFQRGLHKQRYQALCQAQPVKLKRYFDDDPDRMKPAFEEGFFGINIHAGGTADAIDNWSAGCQIIHGGVTGAGWKRFDGLVYAMGLQSQKEIPYTLTRSDALPDWD